jgi:hypothetical protein
MRWYNVLASLILWVALAYLVVYAVVGIARMAIECYGGGCP